MIMKHPSHFRRRTPDLRLTMAPRGGKMGMGRSPAARAKMAVPRTNINDVRVKGFENHADRMSTLFRPEHGVSTQGSSRSRRGSLDLSASDDEDDDLDFIRHAKEAARRLHELNARNAAGKPPTPASRWTAARSKISTAARISGLFRGVEPGSLPPPSAERRTSGGGSGNKVYPASTPSNVRVVTSSSAGAAGPAVRDAEYGMVTPRAQSEHGSERGSVPSTPITVLHSHDAHSVPSSSAPSLAPSVVADPDPGDAPRAHPSTSAPAWNARPTSPATAVHDAHPRGPVEVDVDGRWFVSYDDYHVSMQMAALALRAKNIALDAAMKSSAVEIEQLRKEAQAKAGAPARKLTGWFSPSRKRNLALDKDTHDAKTSSAEDTTETAHTETETPATTSSGTIEEIAEDAGTEGGSDGASVRKRPRRTGPSRRRGSRRNRGWRRSTRRLRRLTPSPTRRWLTWRIWSQPNLWSPPSRPLKPRVRFAGNWSACSRRSEPRSRRSARLGPWSVHSC
jgi:hypothetical protein